MCGHIAKRGVIVPWIINRLRKALGDLAVGAAVPDAVLDETMAPPYC
jgi:hypothetical protein